MELTNKRHIAFADEYLVNGMNGTEAYLSVYKSVTKRSTAEVNASKLLSNTKIKAYISAKQAQTSKKKDVTREFIVDEYLQIIESSKKEGLDGGGSLKDRANWAKALSQLSKLLGLEEAEKQEITHKGISINYIKPDKSGDNI